MGAKAFDKVKDAPDANEVGDDGSCGIRWPCHRGQAAVKAALEEALASLG